MYPCLANGSFFTFNKLFLYVLMTFILTFNDLNSDLSNCVSFPDDSHESLNLGHLF